MLKRADIQVDPSSYVDPQGFLFHHGGNIYRYLRPAAKDLFTELMDSGTLVHLSKNFGLIATRTTDLNLEAERDGLVVSHPKIEPLTYCAEWCGSMLWEAARTTLDLAIELSHRDLILQDAYPWNILFDGAQPVFVDLTSISRPEKSIMWPAHEQYESYFWRPLVLINEGKGSVVRALLTNNIQGIDIDTLTRLASVKTLARSPGILVARSIEHRLQASSALKKRARDLARKAVTQTKPEVRTRFLTGLRKKLDSLRRPARGDCWTEYYAQIDPEFDKQAKLRIVGELLEKYPSPSVLDLGCNTGVFSTEAAKRGARVVSVDASESCIDLLYETARQQGLSITPLVSDIACPTNTGGFMGMQYQPLFERVRSETVLCLGLMHHLHINARQPFERIAALMDQVCGSTLIFEFVGLDDANITLLSTTREIEYSLDSVRAALGVHFPRIDTYDSDRSTRKILLCRK